MSTTTARVLAMSTVLKTRAAGLYLSYVTVFRYISTPRREPSEGVNPCLTAVIRPTDKLRTITHAALHHAVMGQSFGPQADSLSRHCDRYGAPERNFGLAESGPIGVRIAASARVCAVAPHKLDH